MISYEMSSHDGRLPVRTYVVRNSWVRRMYHTGIIYQAHEKQKADWTGRASLNHHLPVVVFEAGTDCSLPRVSNGRHHHRRYVVLIVIVYLRGQWKHKIPFRSSDTQTIRVYGHRYTGTPHELRTLSSFVCITSLPFFSDQ